MNSSRDDLDLPVKVTKPRKAERKMDVFEEARLRSIRWLLYDGWNIERMPMKKVTTK